MTEHKGWRIRQLRGKSIGEVWLPEPKRYKSKSFDTPAAARKWAKDGAADVVRHDASRLETGTALASMLAADHIKGLTNRGRSASHLENVTRTYAGLAKAVPRLDVRDAGKSIEEWLDSLKVSATTRNRMLTEVRSLCRWAIKRDLLAKDPTRAIERSSVVNYLRPQFTVAELVRLLAFPTTDPEWHRRFALLTFAGLRSDEAAAMTWADVDLAGKVLLVRLHAGHRLKRNKERIVPLQPGLAAILGQPGGPKEKVAPLRDENDRRGLAQFLKSCGVELGKRSPHSCRHTYAGLMTATGISGALLGAYMGHQSAATTHGYQKMSALYAASTDGWNRGIFSIL